MRRRGRPTRLRKQPTRRRIRSANVVPMPRTAVPKTARQRKRRNNRRIHIPTRAIMRIVLSARWISLSLLAMTIGSLTTVGLDEDFFLTTIPVEGAVAIPPREIVKASGLAGAHIFYADPNEAAARITEVPGVITATVTLNWPNQVRIQIGEDSPLAIWQESTREFWVTAAGRLIPARTEVPGLLRIEYEGERPVFEDNVEAVENNVADVAQDESAGSVAFVPAEVMTGAVQLRDLRPNIDHLFYRPSDGLSYEDGRGWRAHFGTGHDMLQKLVIYEAIVDDLLARGITPDYVSVSNRRKPFYSAGSSGE